MASTTFTDNITPIAASWLNDVNSATYTILGNGTSYTGVLTLAGTTDSTSTTTGMIINAGGAGIAKALWVGGLANIAGAVTLQNDLAVNGGDLTTSATTFNLLNTTATTVNFAGGASTALNIGNASGTNTVLGATTFSQAGVFSSTLGVATRAYVGADLSSASLPTFVISSTVSGAQVSSGTTQTNGVLRIASSSSNGCVDMGIGGSINWIQSTDRTSLGSLYTLALNPNGGGVTCGGTLGVTGNITATNGNISTGGTANLTLTAGTGTLLLAYNGGVLVGGPTGGDKGAGTANFQGDIYKNDTAYTNPDYVLEHWATGKIEKFADKEGASDYTGLESLQKVEAFARENLHLPRFGQNAGHGLFNGSDALLASVEEAYLHLFAHEARLAALEAKLA